MKVAVVGSRSLWVDRLEEFLPPQTTEIVTGGARGVDSCAMAYAETHGLKQKVFWPDYEQYGKSAPLVRNRLIVDYADCVLAFWDGTSRGTVYTVQYARQQGKPVRIFKSL